jgi:hypothetical protein
MRPHPGMRGHASGQPPCRPRARRGRRAEDSAAQRFWQWFAVVALLFCWIAEATMCAERGF